MPAPSVPLSTSGAIESNSLMLLHCPLFAKARHNIVAAFVSSDVQCSSSNITLKLLFSNNMDWREAVAECTCF